MTTSAHIETTWIQ